MNSRPTSNEKPLSGLVNKPSSEVIYGVFDGEVMRGKDGESYPVLMNYAAKSKLLEGDELELQWPKNGKMIYKRLQRTPRKLATARIVKSGDTYQAFYEGHAYKISPAASQFFKLRAGQRVRIWLPKDSKTHPSRWAAIHSVSKRHQSISEKV